MNKKVYFQQRIGFQAELTRLCPRIEKIWWRTLVLPNTSKFYAVIFFNETSSDSENSCNTFSWGTIQLEENLELRRYSWTIEKWQNPYLCKKTSLLRSSLTYPVKTLNRQLQSHCPYCAKASNLYRVISWPT